MPDHTKAKVDLFKNAIRDRYYTQDRLYDMGVKMQEWRRGSSLKAYINVFDNLARHLQLPKQLKLHYFTFGFNAKLK